MNFLRHGKAAVRLALFAMIAQLVITFGHIEFPGHHIEGELTLAGQALFAPDPLQPVEPHKDSDDNTEFCQTCWTLSTAASLILPVLTHLSLEYAPAPALGPGVQTALILRYTLRPYQGRAPPLTSIL